ncbi:MAG: sulfotransferase, partial [Frankiales bacterium]|nr:sulfotransferase [Frankiales bacterium]
MALPHFLLLGAPKAGTTALHVALSSHPQVFMSTPKEPKFFLTDDGVRPEARGGPGDAQTIRKQVWRRDDYEALFDSAPEGTLRGESTVLYLQDPRAHVRIARTLPDAKLIAVLRDPVDRAHSNWTHLRSAGLEPEADFVRACDLEERRHADGWAPFWRYLALGRYGGQLEHLFSVFPREQVLVLFYRDLREQPDLTLDAVCRFLGIDAGVVVDIPAANVTVESSHSLLNSALGQVLRHGSALGSWVPERLRSTVSGPVVRLLQREQHLREPLRPEQRALLIPRLEDDMRRVESLLDVSLPHWR